MVQEYQSPVRVYKHPFELIMAVSRLVNSAGFHSGLNQELLLGIYHSAYFNGKSVK